MIRINTKNNKKIRFSVIMPCYNSEEYVENAIRSVCEQTYENWELIAVNDGSIDNTLSLLQEWAEADLRIHVYSKDNGGYVSAVNFGLEQISGDYFLFLGSDDRLPCHLFQTVTENLSEALPDMIGFNTLKCWPNKTAIDENTEFDSFAAVFHTDIAAFQRNYPKQSAVFFTRDTARCFKRDLLGETRYYGKTGWDADGIFSMKLAHKATSFMAIPIVGYEWTLRSDSISGKAVTREVNLDRIQNWVEFYRYLMSYKKEQWARAEINYLSYFISIMQQYYLQEGNKSGAEENLKEGIICIKQIHQRFDVPIPKQYRVFILSPHLWNIQKRVKKKYRRMIKNHFEND